MSSYARELTSLPCEMTSKPREMNATIDEMSATIGERYKTRGIIKPHRHIAIKTMCLCGSKPAIFISH
jgi:hypothetical protein